VKRLRQYFNFELKIFLAYILLGGLWILFSDKLVSSMFTNPVMITRIQTFKGWAYVLTTGILFYLFLRHHLIKLRTAEQMAKESDRLKTTFLQNISHEIRTPMNGIMGFTELLKNQDLSEDEKKEFIKIISDSSALLFNIVNEVIDISIIESGTNKVTLSEIRLNSLIDETYDYFTHAVQQGITILSVKDLGNGSDLVSTDAVKVRQVLRNLISNSVKFVEEGYIKFGYEVKGNEIEFFVEDTGIGIPLESQALIFDRFFKGSTQDRKFYEGVGLGLAISKGLVELLEGRIWMESEPGKGSRFHFTIPYRKAEGVKNSIITSSASRANAVGPNYGGITVLLAEDDAHNQRYIYEMLSRLGIKVIPAVNGREAVELFSSYSSIDLVMMDLKMPVMDGYTAAEEIHKLKANAYIVAQTAYTFNEEIKVKAAGFDDYISKPFREEQVIAVLERFRGIKAVVKS